MSPYRLLLLLGGHYHDFDGFEAFMRTLVEPQLATVSLSYEPEDLMDLAGTDVVLLYTCHVEPPENPEHGLQYTEGISDEQTRSLAAWVQAGGGLVAAHSATTIRPENRELQRLVGGRFVSHPPRFPFTVHPMARAHPVTDGVQPFSIVDEFYTQEYDRVDVHAVAEDRGAVHPMVWTRLEGNGRVVHVAPGHDEATWKNPEYQKIMRQAIRWAAEG